MKRFFCLVLLLCLLYPAVGLAYTVSINQFVEHPSLNASVVGFMDELKESGLDIKYNMHNAQGNMPTVLQIVSQIQGENPDLILAVATPSAQATAQKVKNTPVLFTAVTDPVSAGLVKSNEAPGANVSGTTDMNPIHEQVSLIRTLQPEAKRLGVIYNAGEANSVVQVALLKAEASSQGFSVEEATTPNSAGIYQAAKSLVGRVDAIYLPTDNTIISALEPIIKVGVESKIPVYTGEADSVRRGAVASEAIDYYRLGRQTGELAVKIFVEGASPANLPVEALKTTSLIINLGAAEKMGLQIPQEIKDKASAVIK